MPYQTKVLDALEKWGVDTVVYPGWEKRGPIGFAPKGLVVHHTGPGTTANLVKLCINGRKDLAGPLCQIVLDPQGTAHLIAAGRGNHAGTGGWKGLAGNAKVWGIEAVHPGSKTTPWPDAQLKAYVRIAAALAEFSSFGADMVCAHREWTPRKPDPVSIDMGKFRASVAALLTPPTEESAPEPQGYQPRKVSPMFDPPLQIVAWCRVGAALVAVAPDGAVYCDPPDAYQGGMNTDAMKEHFAGRTAAMIAPRTDGPVGYVITATSGETYYLP